jgi:MYXO-CTERM domain-containing protein
MQRRGPGVWFFVWRPPAGLGGSRATFGATFDGAAIVPPRTVPIAADRWNAAYPSHAVGSGCNVVSPGGGAGGTAFLGALGVLGLMVAGRRRRSR